MILLGIPGIGLLLIVLFIVLLPFIALVDIIRSEFTGTNKLIWVIIVIALPVLGTILYFTLGVKQKL